MTDILHPPRSLRPASIAKGPQRFIMGRTVLALMLREMATSYGRSPGGYLWAILEPVAGIALMSAVFSAFMRNPALGISFPVFYATGLIPFVTFTGISNKVATALLFSRPLLAYPRVTFIDAILARFLVNALTELMVSYIVFTGILLFFEDHTTLDIPTIALSLALSCILALGVGTFNCFMNAQFDVWQRVWSILMRPLIILSGVMFLFDYIPLQARVYLWYNPLVHVVGLMRRGFYPTYYATYVSISYVVGFSAVTGLIGLLFLRRYHRDILER